VATPFVCRNSEGVTTEGHPYNDSIEDRTPEGKYNDAIEGCTPEAS
jgi:hypothetical protein